MWHYAPALCTLTRGPHPHLAWPLRAGHAGPSRACCLPTGFLQGPPSRALRCETSRPSWRYRRCQQAGPHAVAARYRRTRALLRQLSSRSNGRHKTSAGGDAARMLTEPGQGKPGTPAAGGRASTPLFPPSILNRMTPHPDSRMRLQGLLDLDTEKGAAFQKGLGVVPAESGPGHTERSDAD